MPRILNLLAESRPVENEVKSEAAFQRLISGVELSTVPRAPRPPSDRGRYPEEVGDDDTYQREETPSDDDHDLDDAPFAYYAPSSTEPISIAKPSTPGGSVNGDELSMCYSESSGYGSMAMDVDIVRSSAYSRSVLTQLTAFRVALFVKHVIDTYQPVEIHSSSDNQCDTFKQAQM